MLNKDELQRIADEVVASAERDAKTMDIEEFIARAKAHILKETGEMIAMHALRLIAQAGPDRMEHKAREARRMEHTAFLIAQAAEIIMRKSWIG